MSLIGNYIGAAVGKSTSDIGELMFRGAERERELALRSEERALDRQLRADIAEGKQEPKIGDEEINELAAGKLGMSVPEVAAHREAVKTGDESQFKLDDYPPGISPETIKAKRQALYGLLEQYKTGKDYKPIEEGRSEARKRGLVDHAIANPDQAPVIAQGVAAGAGKGAYGGTSDVVRNEFTGAVKTTDVGRARIDNLRSDSKLDLAKITDLENKDTLSKEDGVTLTTVVEKANSTIKSLSDNPPGRDAAAKADWQQQMQDATELRKRAMDLLSNKLSDKETTPAPSPALKPPAAKPAPGKKNDYRSLWN